MEYSTDHPIVITGSGLVCALGERVDTAWAQAVLGKSGLGPMRALGCDDPSERVGGEFRDLAPDEEPREIILLCRAFDEAWQQAGPISTAPARRAIVLGTTLAGMRRAARFFRGGVPATMQKFLAGAIAADLADHADVAGPCLSVSAACASGLSSIAHGMTLLRAGMIDVAIVGGYDPISEYAYGGFRSLRLVADDMIRPFMRDRTGMKLGEGYGILILEREADAKARGADIHARVAGMGETSDGFHLTRPHPEGDGVIRAVRTALDQAQVAAEAIDLISLHGTGTPANDAAEFSALQRVFGAALPERRAVAHKAACGHTLGGAGAVELILTLRALQEDCAPPTAGANADDLEFRTLPMVTGPAESRPLRRCLNLSLGFGGSNAAIVIDTGSAAVEGDAPAQGIGVAITGVGAFGPFESLRDWWMTPGAGPADDVPDVDDTQLDERAGGRRARRMSACAKLMLAAARQAAETFDDDTWTSFANGAGAMVGTAHGASAYSEDYYRQIVADGVDAANPWWFAEGVPNIGSAHLSMEMGVHGTAQTVLGTQTAGLDALALAWLRMRAGQWPGAVVAAADEHSELCSTIYADAGLHRSSNPPPRRRGFISAPLAAAVILEPVDGTARSPLAQITSASMRRVVPTAWSVARATEALLAELGDPPAVITTGNGTWVDRAVEAGIRRAARRRGQPIPWAAAFRNRPDGYGAGGLAALAAWVNSGYMPATIDTAAIKADEVVVISAGYHGELCGLCAHRL